MKKVKFGVIGVGAMGGVHARSIGKLDEAEVVAVADVNGAAARKVGDEIGAASFEDYRQLIREGGVEAIVIATPHPFHPEVTKFAAQHGVHVLCEKPLAVTVGLADRMIADCEAGGVLLGVMFQQRTEASRRTMKQMVDKGVLGKLHRVSMFAPWYRPQAYYNSGAWRGTWQGEGGGILMNQSPHSLDQFAWIGGMPQRVQAIADTRLHNIEVENLALSIFDYGDGKVGWLYTSTADIPGGERFEVAGDKGALVWQDGRLRHFKTEQPLSKHLRSCREMFGSLKGEWHDVEIEKTPSGHNEAVRVFARAVRRNNPKLMVANGQDGLNSLELANAILLAGYARREVELPLNRPRYERMLKKLRAGTKPADAAR